MKALKLKKRHYSDFDSLMRDAGVVEGKTARPDLVYANPKDIKKMREALHITAKKWIPFGTDKQREMAVELEMLDLSPAECKGVAPGWVMVDV